MADEFPDPDEEFELMHMEEMEMLQEMESADFDDLDISHHKPKAKRSLDFKSESDSAKINKLSPETDALLNNSFVSHSENDKLPASPAKKLPKSTSIVDGNVSQEPVNTEVLIHALDEVQENPNKRRVEDLFGDIGDLDFEDEHTAKKTKTDGLSEEERQLLTIETIVQERKRLQEAKILPRLATTNTRTSSSVKAVFSRNVPRWNFMPLTDKKGERIYARLRSEEELHKEISELSYQSHLGGLLSVPFDQLQKLAHEQLQKKWDKLEKIEAEKRNEPAEVEIIEQEEKDLWVDKYKPKSYVDLLSDEGTNRALLKWLKLWDKVVFNIERKVKIKPKEDPKGKGRFQKKTGPVVTEELDEYSRPFHKLALLCGPPGLGKTTLAHMIAHHAGYNVVEVNASDDRSPEAFRTQLVAATQMKAVMGLERRPNCLVLDEIDGAPAASIDVLLKFALGKNTGRGKGTKVKKAAGASEKTGILKRPIICICNDVYVPALRPLRQVAFVVHFPPTATARLAQRLCEITKLQSIKADMGVMMALSEKTNNDIRACLALLQCLKLQSGNSVKLSQVHAAAIGQKDMQKGLFTVWQEIFQIPRPKRKTFVDTVNRDANPQSRPDLDSCERKITSSSISERVNSVLKTVQGGGDYERLAQGVFENYLNMKLRDSSMVSVSNGLTWFCHFDMLSTRIHTLQNYVLYPYLAYPFVMWHLLFAGVSWPKLTYPSSVYEMKSKLQKCIATVNEVLKTMMPGIRAYTYREQLMLDTLPLLLEIIVPNLRPVSLTLYSSKEKEELQHVINVMIDYSLTYTQERSPDGNFVFNLDPNVEEVSRFEGGKGCRVLGYSGRQLVSREVELEKLRRAEASLYRDQPPSQLPPMPSTHSPRPATASTSTSTPKVVGKKALPNHLQRLTPKAVKKVEDLQTKDFFGRIVENSLVPNQQKARTDEIVKSDIWYHFKEGFNNAVRRNVLMADLY